MHNEKLNQLRTLARECQSYQIERGLSDAKFVTKVSQVGSTKTYKRILDDADPLEELNVDKQLANYIAATDFIKVLRASDRPPEPEYPDFDNIESSRAAVARAMSEETIARFVVIEGENGTGKDAVKNALLKTWKSSIVVVEATELWRENVNPALADIIVALGIRRREDDSGDSFKLPMHPQARLNTIREELCKRKLILLINEGHHLGPRMLNLVKSIINQTPTVVVLECIPKLLARLVGQNYEEAIQLFGNRLCERVRLVSPSQDEIATLFERRGVKFADTKTENQASGAVATEAPQFGNWRYVVQVCREARESANGKAMTMDQFASAVTRARSRRIMQQKAA